MEKNDSMKYPLKTNKITRNEINLLLTEQGGLLQCFLGPETFIPNLGMNPF